MRNTAFSCFDNFVPGDKYGTPIFCPMHKTIKHLRDLLLCCLDHIKTLKIGEVCIEDNAFYTCKYMITLRY